MTKERANEIIKVKAFEMIELPVMKSDKTFIGKVAITNNGDYLRISDIFTALDIDSILDKLAVFSTIDVTHKAKLSDEPEDETGFFIHLDSFNDDELYSIFKDNIVEWLKTEILPRISLPSENKENEDTIKSEETSQDDNSNDIEGLLKSIDKRLSKIENTLSELLEEDEEDDAEYGIFDEKDFNEFLKTFENHPRFVFKGVKK